MKHIKLLIIPLIIFAIFSVSCKKEETINIVYVTNGVDDITSTEINTSDISSFKLPDDPVLSGYTFLGWYTNKECTIPFTTLDSSSKTVYLFAKWVKNSEASNKIYSITSKLNLSNNYDLVTYDLDATLYNGNLSPITFNDVEIYFELKTKLSNSTQLKEGSNSNSILDNFKVMVYIKGTKIFFSVPIDLVYPDQKIGNLYAQFDLIKFINLLNENYSTHINHYFPILSNADVYTIDNIQYLLKHIEESIYSYSDKLTLFGIDNIALNNLFQYLFGLVSELYKPFDLKPNEALSSLLYSNIKKIQELISSNYMNYLKITNNFYFPKAPLVKIEEHSSYYFSNSLPFYFDNKFNKLEYKDDTDLIFGNITDEGLYIPKYSNNYVFDTNNDFLAYKYIKSAIINDKTIYYGYDGTSYMTNKGEIKSINTINEYTNSNVFSSYGDYYRLNGFIYDKNYNKVDNDVITIINNQLELKRFNEFIELFNSLEENDIQTNIIDNQQHIIINYKIDKLNVNFDGSLSCNNDTVSPVKIAPEYFVDLTNKAYEYLKDVIDDLFYLE